MRIIVVGASGTIGAAVAEALSQRHEVVPVSRSKCAHRVDIAAKDSIERLFSSIGAFEAVVSVAGQAAFRPVDELTDDDFQLSLRSKLMGQVNLVRIGMNHVRDSGSFTLTGGVLAHEPMAYVAAIEGNYNGQTLDARKFV